MSAPGIVVEIVQPDGSRRSLAVPLGASIMRAALQDNIPGILGECGGSTMCATCHVHVTGGPVQALPERSVAENEMLEWTACPRQDNSRLSCQLVATEAMNGLVLTLPEQQV